MWPINWLIGIYYTCVAILHWLSKHPENNSSTQHSAYMMFLLPLVFQHYLISKVSQESAFLCIPVNEVISYMWGQSQIIFCHILKIILGSFHLLNGFRVVKHSGYILSTYFYKQSHGHDKIIKNCFSTLKHLSCLTPDPLPAISIVSTLLHFLGCHVAGIIQNAAFSNPLLSLNNMHLRLLHILLWLGS